MWQYHYLLLSDHHKTNQLKSFRIENDLLICIDFNKIQIRFVQSEKDNFFRRHIRLNVFKQFNDFCWLIGNYYKENPQANKIKQTMLRQQNAQQRSDYTHNYQTGYNCVSRRIFFLHLFEMLFTIKEKIRNNEELQSKDINNIKQSDESQKLSQQFLEHLHTIRDQDQQTENSIESGTIFKAVYHTFKGHILLLFTLYMIDLANRVALTFILQYLFESLVLKNYSHAYIYAAALSLCLIFQVLLRHNQFYQGPILAGKIRSCLILALLKKVSYLNQYVSNKAEIGKVTNMLSNDFNMFEIKAPFLFTLSTIPFVYIAFIGVLVTRLGWPGIICVVTPLAFMPLQTLIGKINGGLLTNINVFKDKRVKLATQLVEGIKHIKIYGWELIFKDMIKEIRMKEMIAFVKIAFGRSVENALSDSTAFFGCYIAFVIIAYTSNDLTNAEVFSTLEFITFLKLSTAMAALGIGFMYELEVVFKRFATVMDLSVIRMVDINSLQNSPDQNQSEQKKIQLGESQIELFEISLKLSKKENQNQAKIQTTMSQLQIGQIQLNNFNAYWKEDFENPTLENISLKIEKGKYYGLTGRVGCGKSALLGAFIGELPYFSGYFKRNGKVSYVEQEPVLFSLTIKDNILFGRKYDQNKYQTVVEAACLLSDFKLFPQRDETLIGQKGVTLSGGQKARLTLARALYQDADIYVLDDPLSAVDTKVAKKIYDQVICGYLKGKTTILSTHQIHFLQTCQKVLVLDKGTVLAFDTFNKVEKHIRQLDVHQQKEQSKDLQAADPQKQAFVPSKKQAQVSEILTQLAPQEQKEKNIKITFKTYFKYLLYWSAVVFFISIVFIVFDEVLYAFFFRLLTFNDKLKGGQQALFGITQKDEFWITLGMICFFYFVFGVLKYFVLYLSILQNNTLIHNDMITYISRAKPYYFDITPSGVFMNKISNDVGVLDTTLIFSLYFAVQGISLSIVLLINIFQIDYYQIIIGMAGVVFLILTFNYCKQTIIETKQLDLKMKSPVYKGLNELISGLVQIHLFERRINYVQELGRRVNESLRSNLSYWFMCRIFGAYATFILMFASIASIFVGIATINAENQGQYAVTVVFFLTMIEVGQWTARQFINTESMMVSAQRCMEVSALESEKALVTDYDKQIGIQEHVGLVEKPDKVWPEKPSIKISNFRFRYREDLPLVLKGLQFEIKAGQKVGIVGRTGAGKSSIIQAFLRLSQPQQDSIYQIDGCDALKMGLHSLRTHISVIPQQPFLFKGTVRKNIDPFDTKTDKQIWNALNLVQLQSFIEQLPQKLQTDLSNAIQVFSVGQKQLFCLSRVLLYRTKIIILDQATSSIDFQTDQFIQNIIRKQFKNETIITIAHRLNTLTDYDKIIVMDKGRVTQIGSPSELMNEKGKFYDMVTYTGKGMKDLIKAIFKIKSNIEKENQNDDKKQ